MRDKHEAQGNLAKENISLEKQIEIFNQSLLFNISKLNDLNEKKDLLTKLTALCREQLDKKLDNSTRQHEILSESLKKQEQETELEAKTELVQELSPRSKEKVFKEFLDGIFAKMQTGKTVKRKIPRNNAKKSLML